ncbi:MAG: hypothetical protein OXR62_04700 [Ahrensia sp.]|nr:hypothetical protein [Ahrensia sp.]
MSDSEKPGDLKDAKQSDEADQLDSKLSSHVPLLLAILVGVSLWVYLYTDYFPVFGSVIGLSGVLVVVPAMRGLMSDERQQAYRAYFDRLLFQSRVTAKLYVVCLIAIAVIGFGVFKPLRFTNVGSAQAISLQYRFAEDDGPKGPWTSLRLLPGQTASSALKRPFFGGPDSLEIKANGLPQFRSSLPVFNWPAITLPGDAWQEPVVLLRADAALMSMLRRRRPLLSVEHSSFDGSGNGTCREPSPWFGEPVWIGGGGGSLSVPGSIRESWQQERALSSLRNAEQAMTLLAAGVARRPDCADPATVPVRLLPNDRLKVTITTGNGDIVAQLEIAVGEDEQFPREVTVRADGS